MPKDGSMSYGLDRGTSKHSQEVLLFVACHSQFNTSFCFPFRQPGEYVEYDFVVDHGDYSFDTYNWEETVLVDVVVRVASNNPTKAVKLVIENDVDSDDKFPTKVLETPGKGWQRFEDVLWSGVTLNKNVIKHRLYVYFLTGNVNLCAVTVKVPRLAPFRSPALDFDEYLDRDANYYNGNACGTEKKGMVDAQATSDTICNVRDGSKCNIGWTFFGEYAIYDFASLDSDDYRVWARVSSDRTDKKVRVELQNRIYNPNFDPLSYEQSSYEFQAPGLGWQEFVDVGFNIYLESGLYRLRVVFPDGQVNFCSAGVEYMAQWSVGEYEIPITFDPLDFRDASDSDLIVQGNCNVRTIENGVDAKTSNDEECLEAGPCYIAFTEPGEFVRYDFQTDVKFDEPRQGLTGPVVTIIARVASRSSTKKITLEVDGSRKTFHSPGKGYESFENIMWENVQLRNTFYHPLYVVFDDGRVNLCSIKVQK